MLQDKPIGFIGAGNMAEALIRGLVKPVGSVAPEHIFASDISQERLNLLNKKYGINIFQDNSVVVKAAEVLVLAVKPQVIHKVLQQISPYIDENKLIISIAAGVNIDNIQNLLKPARIVRTMPNIAALVHAAMTALSPGKYATEDDLQLSKEIFSAVGETAVVEEKLMDAVTGLSGSGPSYIFQIINGLADAGIKVGFSRDIALKLALQTVYGSAKMVIETGEHPMKLRDMVTSPGGTSINGIYELERGGLTATLINAVEAATRRSEELGK
jgi:pyrroline-5-carboxylate reductase